MHTHTNAFYAHIQFMLILEAKALDLQDRVEYFEKLQEKQRKLEELERESSWAKVIEIEQVSDTL